MRRSFFEGETSQRHLEESKLDIVSRIDQIIRKENRTAREEEKRDGRERGLGREKNHETKNTRPK